MKTSYLTFNLKGILSLVSALIVLLFTSCSSSQIFSEPDKGINGSFEYVHENMPVNWYFYLQEELRNRGGGNPETTFIVETDSTDSHEGNRSLYFDVKHCSACGGNFSPGFFKELEATPGASYEVRYWVKNTNATWRVTIDAVREMGGKPHKVIIMNGSENTNGWKEFVVTRYIPEDMHLLRFEVSLLAPGQFKIDDITIRKLGK